MRLRREPELMLVHPWEYPEGPWQKVHIEFVSPVESKMFLVVVDE